MWVLILWLSGLENQKHVYQLYLCAQIVIFTPLWVDGHGKTMFFCDWQAVTWHYLPSHWTIMKQYTLKVEQSKMLKKPVLHATKFWTHDGVQHEKSQSVGIHCGMWRATQMLLLGAKLKPLPPMLSRLTHTLRVVNETVGKIITWTAMVGSSIDESSMLEGEFEPQHSLHSSSDEKILHSSSD